MYMNSTFYKNYSLKKNLKKITLVFLVCSLFIYIAFGIRTMASAQGTSAMGMITLECSTNRVLYEKNADKRLPMASTTKIMTAITVLELCEDIERQVRIPKQAVGVEGSSIYLQQNEQLSIKDLLYGLMLQSGNDCALALAYTISGSVEKFAVEMNALAKTIGAKNSNFVNPHGLHDDKHYTTAKDLGLISSYAMKNPIFKEIVGTKRYTTTWEGRDYDRVILNKNKILSIFQGGNGIKTGYTKRAGRCLVSSAERNGMQVISVVLNCGPMFEECCRLMDNALKSYIMTDIINQNAELCKIKVERGKQTEVKVGAGQTRQYPLATSEKERLHYEFETVEYIKAPVAFGMEVGSVKVYLGNHLLFSEKLYTIEEAEPLNIKDYLKDLIRKWNQI